MPSSKPSPDIRWKQRLQNFESAFLQLKSACDLAKTRELSDLEKQGLIQAFEFNHELIWNLMKDYFDFQGGNQISGSRDATKEAFHRGLIQNGEVWMEMIVSRNRTSHTYNKKIATEIVDDILKQYEPAFQLFLIKMRELALK